ncbi:MAG: VacJ family lipoprotein [Gemmatimonadota bacterium]
MSPTPLRAIAAAVLLAAAALPARPVRALADAAAPAPAADNGAMAPAPAAVDNAAVTPDRAPGGVEPAETFEETPAPGIADPLEPVNRAVFAFNDKAYFWVMKPVAQGYRAVVPQGARVSARNFFSNLGTPVRFANNLLQGRFKGAGTELLRFVINSTIGMAGLFDPAATGFHIEKRDEDLGQTLGRYGLGQGVYIVWPILGPSSARDTVGLVGDYFADPLSYIADPWAEAAVRAYKTENGLSLSIGDYEDLKKSSLDPYAAVRDAYAQNRAKKVRQ